MMTRTEMNMLTERFAEVTGKQNDSVMNSARCAEYLGISQGALRKRVHDGDLISTKYICNDGAYNYDYENAAIRYGDSIIIGKNNGYFIIDKSGNIIEENNHIHLAGFGSPDAILGRKYVLVDWDDGRTSYDGMSIFDLDKGRTDINLHSYINHKYKKPSKLNYTNISTSGNKMVISLKIIFYDNTTTDEKIIVDIDLGEIIE